MRSFLKRKKDFAIAISQFLDLLFWVTLSSTKIMHDFKEEYIHSLKFMSDRPQLSLVRQAEEM